MIRGVVLCGGESKRMGSDKGLLPSGTANWAALAFQKLSQLIIQVCVSVNPKQLAAYQQFFSAKQLIADEGNAKGPLKGLLTVHLKYPDDDLLLLACDMTEMDEGTLNVLLDCAEKYPDYDYFVYAQEDFMEPLCAVYTSSALKKIQQEMESGSLPGFSMHKLIKQGKYKTLPIVNIHSFNNHNTA